MAHSETIVVVGSGLGGVSAAAALRDAGFAGRVVLIGDEAEVPYDRPPLSKSVLVSSELETLLSFDLAATSPLDIPRSIALRPADWFDAQRIECRFGRRATRIDTEAHALEIDGGERLAYDRLILAPGARVRRLPSIEAGAAPHAYLRTLRDAVALRARLKPGANVVLLGGGVIGMEVAASARMIGCEVTVMELAPRIMARALTETLSAHVAAYHQAKGVTLRLGCEVTGSAPGGQPGLMLRDGSIVPVDLVIIGIGVVPNIELARNSGILCQDGIVVDDFAATSAPDVFAAGDAVQYPDSFFGRTMRSENWMHAQNQAAVAARNALGAREPYRQTPYMWSDQYDLKIQVTGRYDTTLNVLRGDPTKNKFMYLHLDGQRVVGASGINESRDIKFAQRLIEAGVAVDPAQLADPAFNLKKAAG
jgi:NADPH-dependent 2,4-dienoyl-CoA reductase/sulfur reductase-like enzyme